MIGLQTQASQPDIHRVTRPDGIRAGYRIAGRTARHQDDWSPRDFPSSSSLETGTGFWLTMRSRRLMDRLEPPPEDLEPER